jgi:hypothetical protein
LANFLAPKKQPNVGTFLIWSAVITGRSKALNRPILASGQADAKCRPANAIFGVSLATAHAGALVDTDFGANFGQVLGFNVVHAHQTNSSIH